MSPYAFFLLFSFSLLGISHCDDLCSFTNLIQNLTFPNSSVRPVKDWKTVTNVSIDLILYTVISLDTSQQSLITLIWFTMQWKNEFLHWNPADQCSMKSVMITGDNLWKPDLYVYEMTEDDDKSPPFLYFNLTNEGTIIDSQPMRIISSCDLNIYHFPFDTQTCTLTFGSYIYPVQEMFMSPRSDSDIVYEKAKKNFVSKGDWILMGITVATQTEQTGNQNYSKVIYTIVLKRVPTVYVITFIIPACFMVILDIISMFIGVEGRIGFKVTIVLGFSVLLLILNTMLPTSETSPMLGIFCIVSMVVMVFSITGTVAVSYILTLSESQTTVPPWIKTWVLTYLATLLCFKSSFKYRNHTNDPESETETYTNNRMIQMNTSKKRQTQKQNKDNKDNLEVNLLKKLLMELLRIHAELIKSRSKEDTKTEWLAVALVVDRLVFIVYLLIIIALCVAAAVVWAMTM